jgi:hypothetical protein
MPQIESKVFPSFANRAIAQKKAKIELKRLRKIEIYAKVLLNDVNSFNEIFPYSFEENMKKLKNLFDLPIDPNQKEIKL